MIDVYALNQQVGALEAVAGSVTASIAGTPFSFLDDLLRKIQEALERIKDKIVQAVTAQIAGIGDAIDRLIGKIQEFVSNIIAKFESIINEIAEAFADAVDGLLSALVSVITAIKQTFEDIVKKLSDFFNELAKKISEGFREALDSIKEFATNVYNKIADALKSAYNTVKDAVVGAIERIQEFAHSIYQWLNETSARIVEKVTTIYHTIVDKIREVLWLVWEKILEAGAFFKDKVIPFMGKVEQDTREGLEIRLSGVNDILTGMTSGDAGKVVSGITKVMMYREPTDLTSILAGAYTVMAVAPQGLSAALRPSLELMTQRAFAGSPIMPLPIDVLGDAVAKGLMGAGDASKELVKQGIAGDRIGILTELARPLPPPGAVQEAYVRGLIDEARHDALLARHGYRGEDIQLFKALYWVIPPLSDIIRMAVREAFTPEIAKKFGQYEDLPEAFVEWAKKQGLTKEWAERYWAAHWDLPSAQMGFEMLHRRIIDEDELKLLLRALDVMPFWREKLIQLSYEPYTRVDVRRMYSMGILTEEDVYWAYRDLGYDDERARNLTEFTVRYYTPEDQTELDQYRQLAQSIYIKAYKRGMIDRNTCIEYLKQLRYRPEDAEFLVRLADAEMQLESEENVNIPRRTQVTTMVIDAYKRGLLREDETREILGDLQYSDYEIDWYIALSEYERNTAMKSYVVESIHQKYVERTYTKAEAEAKLGKIFPYGQELQRLFEIWDLEREQRVRKPTEAQFRAALKAGIIGIEEYKEELRGLGYDEKYVDMLAKLATGGAKYE